MRCFNMSVAGSSGLHYNQLAVQNAVRESTQHDEVASWRQHVFDVRGFHDPYRGQYRRRCGYHWGIIDGMARQTEQVDRLLEQVYNALCGRHPANTLLAFVCRSGRHRAVAWACIFQRLLQRWNCPEGYTLSDLFYTKSDFYRLGCRACRECSDADDRREDAIDQIGSRWRRLQDLR